MTPGTHALPGPRARLAAVLRAAKGVVSIDTAAEALSVERDAAAKLLSRWLEQGWLRRVGRGMYVPVPLDLAGSEQVVEDPWTLVPSLFGECYIGGWTAAHHWDLTEQLFNETVVFTTRRLTRRQVTAQGVGFLLHHVAKDHVFGLKAVWRGTVKVRVSDPARTLIDMLAMPQVGGGIDHVADCLRAHHRASDFDRTRLVDYAARYGNGAVFKRLGFLAESHLGDPELAGLCRAQLTQGYAKLDPALPRQRLVTSWRLWVPQRWRSAAS